MWTSTSSRLTGLPQLVTGDALRGAGVDLDVARRATAAGAWREVLPGAWLRSSREPTLRDRQESALALLGEGAVLTGSDACGVQQLRDVPDDPRTSVLVRHGLQRDLGPTVRLVRTKELPEPLVVRGLPVAPPPRAVLDAARACEVLQDVRALVLAAVADAWCDATSLRGALDEGPRRGSGLCRRALADALRGAASAPEAEVADALRAARAVPAFVLNHGVWLQDRLLAVTDGWLPGTGVGWEVDSRRHHGGSDDLDATLRRHDVFERHRLVLLHVTPRRFRADPTSFVRELVSRVAERLVLSAPEPPGLVVLPPGVRPFAA